MRVKKIMQICQNGPLSKFIYAFLHFVMYSVIEIYAVQIYATSD